MSQRTEEECLFCVGDLHFDTNHFNHIAWRSFDDLAKRLSDRIVAVLGEPST